MRDSFATALGALAACAASPAAAAAVAALKPSSPKRKAASKLRDNALHRCLVAPLAAACADRPSPAAAASLRTAFAGAWLSFLTCSASLPDATDAALVAAALRGLSAPALAPPGSPPSSILHAAACVLFAVRKGLADTLSEAGQRCMLEALVTEATTLSHASSSAEAENATGDAVVGSVVRLTTLLVGALGEIPAPLRMRTEALLSSLVGKVTSSTQLEVARTMRVLAATEPAAPLRAMQAALAAVGAAHSRVSPPSLSALRGSGNAVEAPPSSAAAAAAADVARLHGHSTLLGFFVAGAHSLPLGVPHAAHVQTLDQTHALLNDRHPAAREAGWMLAAALLQVAP